MSGPDDGISGDERARKVGTDERGGNLFVPVRATKKSSGAFQQLVALIQNGHFKRGDKLPPERDMSADFHISRQTMREALYRAELLGLIEVRHGAGSFVLSRPSDDIAETSPLAALEKEAGRIFEVFEIRRLIEGWFAAKASATADAPDLKKMKAHLQRMGELELTDERWEKSDLEFHLAIAGATKNPILVQIMRIWRVSVSTLYQFKRVLSSSEDKEVVWRHHRDIYEAIRKRESETARQRIVDHMDFLEAKIKEDMENIRSS